jgi:hypothetical protein
LRDIDASPGLICGSFVSRAAAAVSDKESRQKAGTTFIIAALCSVAAGCAADIGTMKAERSDGGNQLRYYGGPKSPMWPGQ